MKTGWFNTTLGVLLWTLNPRVYWNTAYEIGYEAGCRDGSNKVGDAAEHERVLSQWGQKRRELLLPGPYGDEVPPRIRGMGKKRRRKTTWDAAYAIGYDEGYSDTVAWVAGKSVKPQMNYQQGHDEGMAHANRLWQAWNERRESAERDGQPFTEPPPSRNGTHSEN